MQGPFRSGVDDHAEAVIGLGVVTTDKAGSPGVGLFEVQGNIPGTEFRGEAPDQFFLIATMHRVAGFADPPLGGTIDMHGMQVFDAVAKTGGLGGQIVLDAVFVVAGKAELEAIFPVAGIEGLGIGPLEQWPQFGAVGGVAIPADAVHNRGVLGFGLLDSLRDAAMTGEADLGPLRLEQTRLVAAMDLVTEATPPGFDRPMEIGASGNFGVTLQAEFAAVRTHRFRSSAGMRLMAVGALRVNPGRAELDFGVACPRHTPFGAPGGDRRRQSEPQSDQQYPISQFHDASPVQITGSAPRFRGKAALPDASL